MDKNSFFSKIIDPDDVATNLFKSVMWGENAKEHKRNQLFKKTLKKLSHKKKANSFIEYLMIKFKSLSKNLKDYKDYLIFYSRKDSKEIIL
jgi:hypothetical protein